MKGALITFEGSESCGKSTQARLLYGYLKAKGHKAVFLREPGGTRLSEKIRKILLDSKNSSFSRLSELLLYMASRAQTVEEVIEPALKSGAIVLCDRFLDSTVVYQGYGLGMDMGFIKNIGRAVTKGIRPDLTILLDLPLKQALSAIGRKDRIEKRSYRYHLKVRRGYFELARKEPQRIKIVRLEDDMHMTQEKIRVIVDRLLKGK